MAKAKAAAASQSTPAAGSNGKRTACPISREQFDKGARPTTVAINGIPMVAGVHNFSTGSFGWYLNGKTVIEVDGVPVSVQVGCNLTVVGSKELA